jgi:hypothetical protein
MQINNKELKLAEILINLYNQDKTNLDIIKIFYVLFSKPFGSDGLTPAVAQAMISSGNYDDYNNMDIITSLSHFDFGITNTIKYLEFAEIFKPTIKVRFNTIDINYEKMKKYILSDNFKTTIFFDSMKVVREFIMSWTSIYITGRKYIHKNADEFKMISKIVCNVLGKRAIKKQQLYIPNIDRTEYETFSRKIIPTSLLNIRTIENHDFNRNVKTTKDDGKFEIKLANFLLRDGVENIIDNTRVWIHQSNIYKRKVYYLTKLIDELFDSIFSSRYQYLYSALSGVIAKSINYNGFYNIDECPFSLRSYVKYNLGIDISADKQRKLIIGVNAFADYLMLDLSDKFIINKHYCNYNGIYIWYTKYKFMGIDTINMKYMREALANWMVKYDMMLPKILSYSIYYHNIKDLDHCNILDKNVDVDYLHKLSEKNHSNIWKMKISALVLSRKEIKTQAEKYIKFYHDEAYYRIDFGFFSSDGPRLYVTHLNNDKKFIFDGSYYLLWN